MVANLTRKPFDFKFKKILLGNLEVYEILTEIRTQYRDCCEVP